MSSLLAILIVVRPRWEALTALALQQGAILLAAMTGRFEPGPWPSPLVAAAPAMASTIIPVAVAWVIPEALGRLGDSVRRSDAAIAVRWSERAAARARTSARQRWVEGARVGVMPFLEAVADGRASTADPEIRALARALEGEVRDELAIPGLLDTAIRRRIRAARLRGCRIAFHGSEAVTADPAVVRALLATALSGRATAVDLTLSFQDDGGNGTVCLVAIPGDPSFNRRLVRKFGPTLRIVDSSPDVEWVELPQTRS
jgi:hypothetical protein